jgi:FrmR/RcnR family transcriptional regulator, repressor of rcnA expression
VCKPQPKFPWTAEAPYCILYSPTLYKRARKAHGAYRSRETTEVGCADVLQMIASVRGGLNSLMAEVMEDHIRFHVIGPACDSEREKGAEELIDVVHMFMK